MKKQIKKMIKKLKSNKEVDIDSIIDQLINVYRLLDSKDDDDYNLCLSFICHVANKNLDDLMYQQILHDCIVKSRIFLYDNLLRKNNDNYKPNISIQDSFLKNFYTSYSSNTTLTKQQKEIFDTFEEHKRLIVSAPTSFGKTRIIREIVSHNKYKNIVLIMPTVSLLSEQYQDIKNHFTEYTISKSSKLNIEPNNKYILILTPERMSAFLEENPKFKVDFFVMDEIYKIDYKLNDDRFRVFSDILYRMAKTQADFYLIGPYISDFSKNFREKFNVEFKVYNTEIVQKDFYSLDNIKDKGTHKIENGSIRIIGDKFKNLQRLTNEESIDGKFLVYRYQKQYVESTSKKFADTLLKITYDEELVNYLKQTVSKNWDLISCIKKGVAFHHGAMPRHIQDLIVDEFNNTKSLNYLFCTTSLTEGINSAAKNVVLFDKKIGNGALLQTLDRKNIEGRAGRFMQHFIGRVFNLESLEDDDSETNVEIEFLDNESPAIESLIQLDTNDIPGSSKKTYEDFIDELKILEILEDEIKNNKFIDVHGQIELIKYFREKNNLDGPYFSELLPNKTCLESILSFYLPKMI